MINVGIVGGDDHLAGELIRILVNHPDVVIRGVCCPTLDGHDITSVHHGLIGETALKFSSDLDFGKLNVLFVTLAPGLSRDFIPDVHSMPELCVIDLYADIEEARATDSLVVYGIPEINRKALVRGARRAVIPSAIETIAAIALYPLALKSMLPDSLACGVEIDSDTLSKPITSFPEKILQPLNSSRPLHLTYDVKASSIPRLVSLRATVPSPMPIDNVMELYDEIYDDHNLTHVINRDVDFREVTGTDKCIVSVTKDDNGMLHIHAIADAALRGGAGDAVHVMNLLNGLYEKTGLTLKANCF